MQNLQAWEFQFVGGTAPKVLITEHARSGAPYLGNLIATLEGAPAGFNRCDMDTLGARGRLIAAAPDLLAALKRQVDAWRAKDANFERELNNGAPEWLVEARAAIAKAAGRAP